jgi:hypothetical protein
LLVHVIKHPVEFVNYVNAVVHIDFTVVIVLVLYRVEVTAVRSGIDVSIAHFAVKPVVRDALDLVLEGDRSEQGALLGHSLVSVLVLVLLDLLVDFYDFVLALLPEPGDQ